ncbi:MULTISPECIES: TfoX/Sxy family protein [Variovorax]|jgi:DNA transformation protein|uniref:TfoX/Sxy family protein n=1 Tax=Variovorax TaxID=34072 RepID=UPI0003634DFA|nr:MULTISPECIES: TfoX/Sxy family protein [Variovorax]MBB3642762.1 DNA transformation protein [Variovorax sp. BK613]MDR6519110.1 DNA transformation protein [Variovorax paradoxus]RTD87784.1 TfoX family protein [Variovorax sp. 369]
MSEFVQSLHEVFERLGRIETKRMFGGHGVWHEGRMIALVADETLYLKSDAESAVHFDRLNLQPFTYMRQGKAMPMSYRLAPADLFEDREEAARWGRLAYEAALRSGQPPKPKKPRKPAARKAAAKKTAAKKAPVKKKKPTAKAASR